MAIKKGTLKNGFKYAVDEDVLDDVELMEDMALAQGDDPLRVVAVIKKVLGEEQKQKLYDHVRDKDSGRVKTSAISDCLTEIFEKLGEEGKNS